MYLSQCLELLEQNLLLNMRFINTALDFFPFFLLMVQIRFVANTSLDELKFIRQQKCITKIY